MRSTQILSTRRALLVFVLAMAGSLTGTLAGPKVVAAFQGAPPWLLPAILVVSVLLALLATFAAFHLARANKRHDSL